MSAIIVGLTDRFMKVKRINVHYPARRPNCDAEVTSACFACDFGLEKRSEPSHAEALDVSQ